MKNYTESDRIEFIKKIEGYEKINAYMDLAKLTKIKKMLHEQGLYKNELYEIKDSSIMNLLLKAQGKKTIRIMKNKFNYKESRRRIIEL